MSGLRWWRWWCECECLWRVLGSNLVGGLLDERVAILLWMATSVENVLPRLGEEANNVILVERIGFRYSLFVNGR